MTAAKPVEPPRVAVAIPHEGYSVVPAELGDPGVLARIHHRVRVRQLDHAWPKIDAGPDGAVWFGHRKVEVFDAYPVIGEAASAVRVVLDDKHAIYAVWIARDDLRTVPLVDVALAPGATVFAGAPVERRGDRVRLLDSTLAIEGPVEPRLLGEVWLDRPRDKPRSATRQLAPATPIRATPNGQVIATDTDAREVAVIASGAWTEIELADKHARVHGFVPATALFDELHGFGTGSGYGIGVSDTDHFVVPKGTCIFDSLGGEVMGVETVEENRYAYRPTADHPGWWRVYLSTPWGAQIAWVHEGESCASGR